MSEACETLASSMVQKQCINRLCKMTYLLIDEEAHRFSCVKRIVKCDICKKSMIYEFLSIHIDDCRNKDHSSTSTTKTSNSSLSNYSTPIKSTPTRTSRYSSPTRTSQIISNETPNSITKAKQFLSELSKNPNHDSTTGSPSVYSYPLTGDILRSSVNPLRKDISPIKMKSLFNNKHQDEIKSNSDQNTEMEIPSSSVSSTPAATTNGSIILANGDTYKGELSAETMHGKVNWN